MWYTLVKEYERNCELRAVAVAPPLEIGDATEEDVLLDSSKLKADSVKLEHLVFGISEGLEVLLLWDGRPLLPLSGRGRLDFTETRGTTGGKVLSAQVTRAKAEVSPFRTVFLLFEMLKQREA